VPGGGKPAHVTAGLGDDHVGDDGEDPGNGDDEVPGRTKGSHRLLDTFVQLFDSATVAIDKVEMQPGEEAVVLTEAPRQGLGEFGDLRAHASLGEIGQSGGVPVTCDQRLQHRPTRDAGDVARYRGELDPGVLEELFEALDLASALSRDRGARPCEVTKLSDRLGRDEGSPDESVSAELGKPG